MFAWMTITKNFRPLFFAGILLLLGACATTAYVGDRYAPTTTIDVFYSGKDVKREYKVIGHISEKSPGLNGDEWAKKQIIAKGQEVGADAVIILGFNYAGSDEAEKYQKAEAIKYTD